MTDKKTLKQALRAHYQQTRLDQDQLAGLDHLQRSYQPEQASESNVPETKAAEKRRSYQLATALFATLLLGFFGGHLLSKYHYQQQIEQVSLQTAPTSSVYTTDALIRDIAEEITFNHRKLKPLEIQTHNFDDLLGYFSMLDFRPYLSEYFKPEGQLIGGRYCSIGTVSAVQLRYQDAQGDITTLYQTSYDPDAFRGLPDVEQGDSAVTQYLNGYKVSLWIERGIVMATVASPDQ
jgi:hypothetical protein